MTAETTVALEQPLRLIIDIEDLDGRSKGVLKSIQDGERVYGGSEDAEKVLFDALPAVIAKKLRMIKPPDFVIKEIEIKFAVDIKIGGTGISGDVGVKFAPDLQIADPKKTG